MRILLIGDIHAGKSSDSTSHPGIIRQANTEALEKFKSLLPYFQSQDFDLIVNMGDMLRDVYDKELDSDNIRHTLRLLNKIEKPTIHILGNHELQALSFKDICQLYNEESVEPKFYGSQKFEDFQLVWLDFERDEKKHIYLSIERLKWLDKILSADLQTIIFSHYSLVPINSKGNFYFEEEPGAMHYANSDQIMEVIREKKVQLSVNAHVHMLSHQVQNNIHFISNPSFTENIAAANHPGNNPGVYSELVLSDKGYIFSSYSDQFCFAKIEGK